MGKVVWGFGFVSDKDGEVDSPSGLLEVPVDTHCVQVDKLTSWTIFGGNTSTPTLTCTCTCTKSKFGLVPVDQISNEF